MRFCSSIFRVSSAMYFQLLSESFPPHHRYFQFPSITINYRDLNRNRNLNNSWAFKEWIFSIQSRMVHDNGNRIVWQIESLKGENQQEIIQLCTVLMITKREMKEVIGIEKDEQDWQLCMFNLSDFLLLNLFQMGSNGIRTVDIANHSSSPLCW